MSAKCEPSSHESCQLTASRAGRINLASFQAQHLSQPNQPRAFTSHQHPSTGHHIAFGFGFGSGGEREARIVTPGVGVGTWCGTSTQQCILKPIIPGIKQTGSTHWVLPTTGDTEKNPQQLRPNFQVASLQLHSQQWIPTRGWSCCGCMSPSSSSRRLQVTD